MNKLLKKGIAQDKTYIALMFQCTNGIDTYTKRFIIKEKHNLFLGYGTHVRTPDFFITIKGVKYACFYVDGKTIKIPRDNRFEYDGVCYVEE